MARVARELGFTTMSLYRYVTSKDELLQLMWNASAQGAEHLIAAGRGLAAPAAVWAIVQREMIDRHPWITQMPMAAPPLAPNSLAFVERGLEALDETGLRDADKLRVIGLLSSYTLSEARMAHDAARARAGRAGRICGRGPARAGATRRCCGSSPTSRPTRGCTGSPGPRTSAASPSGFEEREEFLFGVDAILDGVQALIDRSKTSGAQ